MLWIPVLGRRTRRVLRLCWGPCPVAARLPSPLSRHCHHRRTPPPSTHVGALLLRGVVQVARRAGVLPSACRLSRWIGRAARSRAPARASYFSIAISGAARPPLTGARGRAVPPSPLCRSYMSSLWWCKRPVVLWLRACLVIGQGAGPTRTPSHAMLQSPHASRTEDWEARQFFDQHGEGQGRQGRRHMQCCSHRAREGLRTGDPAGLFRAAWRGAGPTGTPSRARRTAEWEARPFFDQHGEGQGRQGHSHRQRCNYRACAILVGCVGPGNR